MRRATAGLAVVAVLAAVVPARAAEKIDARMLLDLDLLREDPARYRDQAAVERMRMLELMRVLETPPASAQERAPEPAPAAPPPAQRGAK